MKQEDSLDKKLGKSIFSSATSKYLVYVIQLISLALLARFFEPETFGLVASVHVFAMFFQMVSNTAITPAIMYQTDLKESERDGIFTFLLLLGLSLSLVFLSFSVVTDYLYPFTIDFDVFIALSLFVFMSTAATMPMAALQKDRKFRHIAYADMLGELISFLTIIALIDFIQDQTLLALKFSIAQIVRVICYLTYASVTRIGRPKLSKEILKFRIIYEFSKNQIYFNTLNYFSRNLDNILVAKYFGMTTLAFYEKTYQLMRYPLQVFTFAVNPALMPVLTEHKNNPVEVASSYYRVTYILAMIGLFCGTVMFFSAESIVYIVFGPNWIESSNYLKIFSISIPIQMVLSSTGGVFQAFGKSNEMLKCGIFSAITNVSAIVAGIYAGNIYLLCALLIVAFTFNLLQAFYVLNTRVFNISLGSAFKISAVCCLLWPLMWFFTTETATESGFLSAVTHIFLVSTYTLISLSPVLFVLRKKLFHSAYRK